MRRCLSSARIRAFKKVVPIYLLTFEIHYLDAQNWDQNKKKTHFPLKKDSFIRYNWLIVFYFTSTWRTCLPYWDINLRVAASPKLHQQFIYWTSLQYYNSIQASEIFHTNVTNMACVKKTDIFIQKYRYEVWGSRFKTALILMLLKNL